MMVRYVSVILASLMLMALFWSFASRDFCNHSSRCRRDSLGAIVGGNKQQFDEAVKELRNSADTYKRWSGAAAPIGIVVLDNRIAAPTSAIRRYHWILTYDPLRSKIVEGELREDSPGNQAARNVGARLIDETFGRSGRIASYRRLQRTGVLSHEICHQYALFLYRKAWAGRRSLPDALGETAAVSCEAAEMRAERMRGFRRVYLAGLQTPWQEFVGMAHPLSRQVELTERQVGKKSKDIMYFKLSSGTRMARDVANYYGQSASLSEFISSRSCRRLEALGGLLTSFDPERGFDAWLKVNGRIFCLPTDLAAFNKEFSKFMRAT